MIEINGKAVDKGSIEIEGVDMKDYPDLVDTFISTAYFNDGVELTESECETLQENNSDLVHELALDSIY